MSWIEANIVSVMTVTGVITASVIGQALAPRTALRLVYGEDPAGTAVTAMLRHWGLLVSLTGLFVIYGAYHEEVRAAALVLATVSKVVFAAIIIAQAGRLAAKMPLAFAAADLAMAGLFIWYMGVSGVFAAS